MSRMIEKLGAFGAILSECNINTDMNNAINLMTKLENFYKPPPVRTDGEVMADILARMQADIEALQDGLTVEKTDLMREHGLDPHNRSDSARVTHFLKESGLLMHKGAEPEKWVRRITNGAAKGSAAAHDTAAD